MLWPCLHYNWTIEIIKSFLRKILVLNQKAKVFSPKDFCYTVLSTHTRHYSTYSHICACLACLLARHAFTLRTVPGWPGDVCRAEFGSARFDSGPCRSHFHFNRDNSRQPELKVKYERGIRLPSTAKTLLLHQCF